MWLIEISKKLMNWDWVPAFKYCSPWPLRGFHGLSYFQAYQAGQLLPALTIWFSPALFDTASMAIYKHQAHYQTSKMKLIGVIKFDKNHQLHCVLVSNTMWNSFSQVSRTVIIPSWVFDSNIFQDLFQSGAKNEITLAISERKEPCSAINFPKTFLLRALWAIICMPRSAAPISLMQWCSLPGPSLPCKKVNSGRDKNIYLVGFNTVPIPVPVTKLI